ncbi:MAG: MBL fold metallo-hydrolase [Clostridium sp.]|nr:MBL fold metallo-hydrolase [Clostridium sp.]
MAKVCQLFSGSSGNSILISYKEHHFLVDIGVSAKKCENALIALGIHPDDIDAIFITHEHKDHCSGVRVFSCKHNTPVYAAADCLEEMYINGTINEKVNAEKIEYRMELCDTEVLTFKQSHDSVDCIGYRFNLPNGISICVCTDTGYITDNAREICSGADLIFIESNHEVSMVQNGPYPYPLKQRILGTKGHLSNFACGEFIKELANSGTKRFVLAHLSRENNMPDIARQTAIASLSEIGLTEGIDYRLYVSSPENRGRGIAL